MPKALTEEGGREKGKSKKASVSTQKCEKYPRQEGVQSHLESSILAQIVFIC